MNVTNETGLPLRVRLKARKSGDSAVYLAREVHVYCGEQRVAGIARIQFDLQPASIAAIDLRVYAVIETETDDTPSPP